jgi:hypothetical protein
MPLIALTPGEAVSNAQSLNAMLDAFAALGSVVGVFTAWAAFLSVMFDEDAEQAAAAATTAAGIGFLPGLAAAFAVYFMSLSTAHAL